VPERASPAVRTAAPEVSLGNGVTVAELLNTHALRQRRLSVSGPLHGTAAGQGEAWYVMAGSGELQDTIPLRPGTAVWLPSSAAYQVAGTGLRILAVSVLSLDIRTACCVTHLDDCEPEYTGDREFRVLLSAGLPITMFNGRIPPGRAPEHQHTYDEVVHILAGHGVVHLGGSTARIGPGTSIYLPPYQPHCLEALPMAGGAGGLEVLGVFYPAGSPAAKHQAAKHQAAKAATP
jgi:mannose-6-phosphate isomerase-like protein (cupin superfamily)